MKHGTCNDSAANYISRFVYDIHVHVLTVVRECSVHVSIRHLTLGVHCEL